ncbi:hypothetical protein ERJ75_000567400 [Trypanosoma vivax]|nr:hypothetical protein ERJ75_000567400 [Trypanosoma vivax]
MSDRGRRLLRRGAEAQLAVTGASDAVLGAIPPLLAPAAHSRQMPSRSQRGTALSQWGIAASTLPAAKGRTEPREQHVRSDTSSARNETGGKRRDKGTTRASRPDGERKECQRHSDQARSRACSARRTWRM